MVAESYDRYIRRRLDRDAAATVTAARDLFVSGGGAHNSALMRSPVTNEPPHYTAVVETKRKDPPNKGHPSIKDIRFCPILIH